MGKVWVVMEVPMDILATTPGPVDLHRVFVLTAAAAAQAPAAPVVVEFYSGAMGTLLLTRQPC
jgi:hypothetical protein